MLALVGVGVVLVAVAVGVGAYLGTRSSGDEASPAVTQPVETSPGATSGVDGSDPELPATDDRAPTLEAPGGASDRSSAPSGGSSPAAGVLLDDPDHLVTLRLPGAYVVDQPFDGRSARWTRGDVTFSYHVQPGATAADADRREASVAAGLAVRYRPDPEITSDGRYIVSAHDPSAGRSFYERGRIRCGDLVWYRFEWPARSADEASPTAEEGIEELFSPDNVDDSMGGEHATCGR